MAVIHPWFPNLPAHPKLAGFKPPAKPNYADELIAANGAFASLRDTVLRSLNIPQGALVLDVGCFDGRHSRWVADNVPGASVVGIDVNRWGIVRARKTTPTEYDGRVLYLLSNAAPTGIPDPKYPERIPPNYMPVRDQAFTDILCICNLQNIPNVNALCGECNRSLAPGGRMHVVEQSVDLGLSAETQATVTRALAARYQGKRKGPDAGRGEVDLTANLTAHGFIPTGPQRVERLVLTGPITGEALRFVTEQVRTLWDRLLREPGPDDTQEFHDAWDRTQPHVGAAARAELAQFATPEGRVAHFERPEARVIATDYAASGVARQASTAAAGSGRSDAAGDVFGGSV